MPIFSFFLSLAITLAIETGVYMILKHRDFKLLLIVSFLNLILNVSMNIILFYVPKDETTYWLILILYEIGTTLLESLVIWLVMRFKYLKILLFAFIANLSSFLVGFALQPLYDNQTAVIILMSVFFSIYLFTYLFVLIDYIRNHAKQ